MPQDFTVTLSDAEIRGFLHVAVDVNDWIQNAVHERARLAMNELAKDDIDSKMASGQPISGTMEEMVLASTLPTAEERNTTMHAAAQAQMAAIISSQNN